MMLTVPLELMSLPVHLNVAHDPWTICRGVLSNKFGVPVELLRDPSNLFLLVPQSAFNFCVSGRFRWGTKGFHTEIDFPILTLAVHGGSRQQSLQTPSLAPSIHYSSGALWQLLLLRLQSLMRSLPQRFPWSLRLSTCFATIRSAKLVSVCSGQ